MENYELNQNPSDNNNKKPLSKAAKQGLIIFGAILALLLVLGLVQFFISISTTTELKSQAEDSTRRQDVREVFSDDNDDSSETVATSFRANDYIAVLYIEGVIQDENHTYSQSWLLDTIENLTYSSNNKALLLYINSPGGGVYQSDEAYLALEEYKAYTGNPVWAYMGDIAASGGYYIAAAADTIYANRNTWTGSIGVMAGQSIDLTEFMATHGIKMTTITSGKNKNMMNIDSPFTTEQKDIMQSIADEAYDQFTGIIAQSREMDIEYVKELADGRIYTASQAVQNGLIDKVDTFENTLFDMETILFDGNELAVKHYQYAYEKNFYDFFMGIAEVFSKKDASSDMQILDTLLTNVGLPENMEFPAYYFKR